MTRSNGGSLRGALFAVVLHLGTGAALAAAAEKPAQAIELEIPVLAQWQSRVDWLAYPAYIAVALDNIGLSPSLSSRATIRGGQELQLGGAVLRYTGRKGLIFSYEAGITLASGVGETSLAFPVEVDASRIAQGRLAVTLTPPLAQLIPRQLVDKIQFKTQTIADLSAQKRILDYLDGLAQKLPGVNGAAVPPQALFEPILIDAYNRNAAAGPAPGSVPGEPPHDRILVILTFILWLVLLPLLLFLARRRRPTAQ